MTDHKNIRISAETHRKLKETAREEFGAEDNIAWDALISLKLDQDSGSLPDIRG